MAEVMGLPGSTSAIISSLKIDRGGDPVVTHETADVLSKRLEITRSFIGTMGDLAGEQSKRESGMKLGHFILTGESGEQWYMYRDIQNGRWTMIEMPEGKSFSGGRPDGATEIIHIGGDFTDDGIKVNTLEIAQNPAGILFSDDNEVVGGNSQSLDLTKPETYFGEIPEATMAKWSGIIKQATEEVKREMAG